MTDWMTYGIYALAGGLVFYSIGNASWPITREPKVLAASILSIGLAAAAVLSPHWWLLFVGFAVNLVAGKYFREPIEQIELPQNWLHSASSERTKVEVHDGEVFRKTDEQRIEEIVEGFFDDDRTPPTSEICLQPGRWLEELKVALVVELRLLKEIVNNKKKDYEGGSVFVGGNADRRAVLEVLHRWFNMSPITPEDGSYLVLDEILTIEFAGHVTELLKDKSTRYACFECQSWHRKAIDRSEKGSSSLVHADGVIRFTCPNRHVIYERQYRNRIFMG